MLTKCICTNCAGHLEFEEDNAGEKIKCPHCGFETVLFLPGHEPAEPLDDESSGLRLKRSFLVGAATLLLALVALVYSLNRWVLPQVKDWLPQTDSNLLPVLALAAGCLLLVVAVVWAAFPIVLFLQLRKMTKVLSDIETNLRPMGTAEPTIDQEGPGEPVELANAASADEPETRV